MDRLHGRINDLDRRVTMLEVQVPHINSTLTRIETSVEKMNAHVVKAIWLILALFIGIVFQFTVKGGFTAL